MLSDSVKTPNGVTSSYRIVEFLSKKGVKFTAKAYSVLVKGFGVQRNDQMVDRLLVDCRDNNIPSDVILFNTAIDAYIRCDHKRKAISLFDLVVSDGLVQANGQIAKSSSAGAGTKAKKQIADQEPSMREALRKKLMGAEIVQATNDSGDDDDTPGGQRQEAKPSQRAISRSSDYLKALSKVFIDSQVRPNVRSYNTLLKALKGSGIGSFERCMDVVSTMRRQGIPPDSVTLNTLVDVSVSSGNLQAAEDLLSQPIAVPGVEAYTSLISGHATLGNVEEAFRVLEQMRQRRVSPNIFTLTSLMKTCVRREDWQRARELLAMGDHYLNPTTDQNRTLAQISQLTTLRGSFVIGLCGMALTSGDLEDRELFLNEAQRELLRMELDGMKPDTATMNAFIQGLCAMHTPAGYSGRSRVADALMVLRAMRRERIEPDDYTYSILFAALGREGFVNEALQLFKTAKRQMDATAVNALLRAFVSGQDPLQAVKLYQELISTNSSILADFGHFEPTKYTYTILFVALTKSFTPPEPKYPSLKERFFQSTSRSSNSGSNSGSGSGSGSNSGGGGASSGGNAAARSWNPDTKFVNKESVFRSKYLGALTSMEQSNSTDMRALVVDTTLIDTMSVSSNITRQPSALTTLGRVIEQIVIVRKKSISEVGVRAPVGTSTGGVAGTAGAEPSQSLVYDTAQGRFYEQASDAPGDATAGVDVGGVGGGGKDVGTGVTAVTAVTDPPLTVVAVDGQAPGARASSATEDVRSPDPAAVTATVPGTVAAIAAVTTAPASASPSTPTRTTAPTPAPAPAAASASAPAPARPTARAPEASRSTDLMTLTIDELLQKLYKTMRYDREIEPDDVMVGALNSLFASQGYNRAADSGLAYYDPADATPPKPTIDGLRRRTIFSKKSAELVFEDLAISGWHPTLIRPILRSCSYPQHQMEELLREGENNLALKKLRASSASVRIFKKHGWNKMESGWTGFF